MPGYNGPFLSPDIKQQVARAVVAPLMVNFSGQITADKYDMIGAARMAGKVSDVWLSVGTSGKDDSHDLYLEADVYINDVSCLTTKPKLAHVSGEASMQKTSKVTGDTGVTQAVINHSANSVSIGDVFKVKWDLTRTASPTTEMADAVLVVELKPN